MDNVTGINTVDNPASQKDYKIANQASQDKYQSPVNPRLPFYYLISLSSMEREVIFGVKEIEPESWSYKEQGSRDPALWGLDLSGSFYQFLGPIQGFPGGTSSKESACQCRR